VYEGIQAFTARASMKIIQVAIQTSSAACEVAVRFLFLENNAQRLVTL